MLDVRLGSETEAMGIQMNSLCLVQWARGRIEQCLLICYHCVTDYHKTQWLKTIIYLDYGFVKRQLGLAQLCGPSGLDWTHVTESAAGLAGLVGPQPGQVVSAPCGLIFQLTSPACSHLGSVPSEGQDVYEAS